MKLKQTVLAQKPPLMSEAALAALISQRSKGPAAQKLPLMQLSARQPWDAVHGFFDVENAGRWDTSTDQILMTSNPVPDPSEPGDWTGSMGYITFHPPASGTYLMVIQFWGYSLTMKLNGPNLTETAIGTANTPTAVSMLFNGTAGKNADFSFLCTGIYLGYVQAIQVFAL